MLRTLVDYIGPTQPGFAPKRVRWALSFTAKGDFLGVVELGDSENKRNRGIEFPMCPDLPPNLIAGGNEARSHFLVESAEVVCLVPSKDQNAGKKAEEKRKYFIKLLREAGMSSMQSLLPIAQALSDPQVTDRIRNECISKKVDPSDKVTICIGDAYPVESDEWHPWWQTHRDEMIRSSGKTKNTKEMRCFVCGKLSEPRLTHDKIRGLADVGGLSTGDSLIGFDKDAFKSYGLKQSENCAVCDSCVSSYKSALDKLISRSTRFGGVKVVHWFSHSVDQEDDPLAWLIEGITSEQEEQMAQRTAKRFLESIRTGERSGLGDYWFYAVTLSGAAGRVMVRDWIEGRFGELAENINKWFEDFEIVRRDGSGLAPNPRFAAILRSLASDSGDGEVPAPLISKLWKSAVQGAPIPREALAQAVYTARSRFIEGETVDSVLIGLMKAYQNRKEGGIKMSPYLNEENPHPAYQCGRLLAVLADLQRAALGDVGAGVVQNYYPAASSSPGLVLGRLIRLAQYHISKLDKGLAYWYNTRIADILARIPDGLPVTLTLEEQSLFALGYYQQIAADRSRTSTNNTKNEEAKEENVNA